MNENLIVQAFVSPTGGDDTFNLHEAIRRADTVVLEAGRYNISQCLTFDRGHQALIGYKRRHWWQFWKRSRTEIHAMPELLKGDRAVMIYCPGGGEHYAFYNLHLCGDFDAVVKIEETDK